MWCRISSSRPNRAVLLLPLLLLVAFVFASSVVSATYTCPEPWWWPNATHSRVPGAYRDASAYGAVGDGVSDDTAALQAALYSARGGESGSGASKQPAIVYLPPGDYLVRDTLVLWLWTALRGHARCRPRILLAPHSPGFNGSDGALRGFKPLLVASNGFNLTATTGAWWEQTDEVGGVTNENFHTTLQDVDIVIGDGNPGAVALTWNVAQQTSVRNVSINAGCAAIGLDVGLANDYQHLSDGVPFTLGGGGSIEGVNISGGTIGMRTAVTQFFFRSVWLRGALDTALVMSSAEMTWAQTFLDLTLDSAPLGVRLSGAAGGTALLDSRAVNIMGGTVIATDATSVLYLQNFVAEGAAWIVDASLVGNASGVASVASWVQGAVWLNGEPAAAARGALPLPPQAAAGRAGLACGGRLCGGSREDPATGYPLRPRPLFEDARGVANVYDYGATGDGRTDDTHALQAALNSSASVFIPFGIYLVTDTLYLRPDSRVVGENGPFILLGANAPGFGSPAAPKPFIVAPAGGTVWLADVKLVSDGCGLDGAIMLDWSAGPGSSLWDVCMLLPYAVYRKTAIRGAGSALFSNTWFVASQWDLAAPAARALAAAGGRGANGGGARAAPACPFTQVGHEVTSTGPVWWATNSEHSVETEWHLAAGSANQIFAFVQTEETKRAIAFNGTAGAVVFSAVSPYWNASIQVPAVLAATCAGPCAGADVYDSSYRVYAALEFGSNTRLRDPRFSIAAGGPGKWASTGAILNPGAEGGELSELSPL